MTTYIFWCDSQWRFVKNLLESLTKGRSSIDTSKLITHKATIWLLFKHILTHIGHTLFLRRIRITGMLAVMIIQSGHKTLYMRLLCVMLFNVWNMVPCIFGSRKWCLPLLNAQVCVDAGITSCACEIFVFSVGYVLSRPVVPVFFGQTKVDEEQLQQKQHIPAL